MDFEDFEGMFSKATGGKKPFQYQTRLAESDTLPQLIRIPTGAGKTAAVVLAWLWRRRFGTETVRKSTPRRLVYCLPMRVLVEQTRDNAILWLHNLGLLGGTAEIDSKNGEKVVKAYTPAWHDPEKIVVTVLMGGEDADEWDLYPERDVILVGTQDMLLSRALNRGYGMSPYRWPMHFGLLNNDCLWVIDEVQLMGSGLATTAQMQAFRREMGTIGKVQTVWMSATFEPKWLELVDFDPELDATGECRLDSADLDESEELQKRMHASKTLRRARAAAGDADALATEVLRAHRAKSRTLVVMNTVERASLLHQALEKHKPSSRLILIHSHFRPPDRRDVVKGLLAAPSEPGSIIVSTQVVEAGVDVSASVIFTELAPWVSLVQRFGRCNRGGEPEGGDAYWIDLPTDGKEGMALPYQEVELSRARSMLKLLEGTDISPANLEALIKKLSEEEKLALFPMAASRVIRRHDVHGLFSTEPDLAGGFTDVSPYVRDREREVDVYVYWRDVDNVPLHEAPLRDELCPVPFYSLHDFLGDKGTAWEWDGELERWAKRNKREIRPGMTLLLPADKGGYSERVGWTGRAEDKPVPHPGPYVHQNSMRRDMESLSDWLPLADHLGDTEREANALVEKLELGAGPVGRALLLAAYWHDVGKSHARWQDPLKEYAPLGKMGPWAKFKEINDFRPPLRHEAASALAAWDMWRRREAGWNGLAVYLVSAHHGKVRTVLRQTKLREGVFGVREGDGLPALPGWIPNGCMLDTNPKTIGAVGQWNESEGTFTPSGPSWVGMMAELLGPEIPGDPAPCDAVPDSEPRGLGPFKLAFLEGVMRAADARASRPLRVEANQ